MSGKDKVKVGVFGVGSLGHVHARIYSELPGVELVGVCDAHRGRAEEVAAKYHTQAFDQVDALAAQIDAASVAVPTDKHREVAGRLLEKGLHLLVEKPIATTTAEAEALVELARNRDLILQVGHVERFNPVLDFLDKSSARPVFIEAHRLGIYPVPLLPGMKPRGTEVSVILDLMIHDLEVVLHLVRSKVKEIHAVGVPILSPTEDIANVRLLFENGCVANITASRVSAKRMRKIRCFMDDFSYLSLDYQNQSGEVYRKGGLLGITRESIALEKGEPLARELRSFVQCVANHGEPVVSGEHAAGALKLAIDIHQRLREGPS